MLKKSGEVPEHGKWVLSAKFRPNEINGLGFQGCADRA
jgi:hypothetical protein